MAAGWRRPLGSHHEGPNLQQSARAPCSLPTWRLPSTAAGRGRGTSIWGEERGPAVERRGAGAEGGGRRRGRRERGLARCRLGRSCQPAGSLPRSPGGPGGGAGDRRAPTVASSSFLRLPSRGAGPAALAIRRQHPLPGWGGPAGLDGAPWQALKNSLWPKPESTGCRGRCRLLGAFRAVARFGD